MQYDAADADHGFVRRLGEACGIKQVGISWVGSTAVMVRQESTGHAVDFCVHLAGGEFCWSEPFS